MRAHKIRRTNHRQIRQLLEDAELVVKLSYAKATGSASVEILASEVAQIIPQTGFLEIWQQDQGCVTAKISDSISLAIYKDRTRGLTECRVTRRQ